MSHRTRTSLGDAYTRLDIFDDKLNNIWKEVRNLDDFTSFGDWSKNIWCSWQVAASVDTTNKKTKKTAAKCIVTNGNSLNMEMVR